MRQALLIPALLLIAGCPKPEPTPELLNIEVEPSELVFLDVAADTTAVLPLTLRSTGDTPVFLNELEPLISPAFRLMDDPGSFTMEPGEERVFDIGYTPSTAMEDRGWLAVRSIAPTERELLVDLWGNLWPPELLIEPLAIDFGNLLPGQTATEDIRISNIGGSPLFIDQITLDGPSAFSVAIPPLGRLDAGETMLAPVTFAPAALAPDPFEGLVTITHDQGEPTEVTLLGESKNDPLAICRATPPVIHAWVDRSSFDGSASYNPQGGPITRYRWELVRQPPGSAATLPINDQAIVPNFRPDLAGEYVASLVVTNDMGVESSPCLATLTATITDDLWIEMYWERRADDMDLHLIAPGGQRETDSDCYYSNCVGSGLNWGSLASSDDDPSLDFDDVPGRGPENINIATPAPGTYGVYVHDYPGSVLNRGNVVTVNIYVFGTLAWQGTKEIVGEDSFNHFADVSFPDGVVTPF